MSRRTLLRGGITSLLVALGGLAGCEGGGGDPLPETGGAGIPGRKGAVSSNMPKAGAAKGARQGAGPGARGAAPQPAPEGAGSGATPAAPKE
jgi:hypothetical protein